MRKSSLLLFLLSVFYIQLSFGQTQQVLVFDENFNSGTSTLQLNSNGVGTHSGSNKWIINDTYTTSVYTNTTDQSVTSTGGLITAAPNSPYMHIHDQGNVATGANANYNPTAVSDNFVNMPFGVCTKGLKGAQLSFYYIINSSPTAFGELYYSIKGGPWIKKGSNYQNSAGSPTQWKYEIVTDPVFDNQEDLRFGFRWVNDASSAPVNAISWGIDDIQIVGTFDNSGTVDPAITIKIKNLPASICRSGGGTAIFGFINLSDTLCDGQYKIELSDGSGNFSASPPTWTTNIFYPDTVGFINVLIPASVPSGSCYKFKVSRLSPAPVFDGVVSVCFEIKDCPNTITTMEPVVTKDTCHVCIGSIMDIPFLSTGTFNTNNVYTAQLSDVNGTFNTPVNIGVLPTGQEFPNPIMPGSVATNPIPLNTLPGCNYFVRIISSNPKDTGSVFGPFCIRECDIKTNNLLDVHVCVTQTQGQTVVIPIDINMWNTLTNYGTNNQFEPQLLTMDNLLVVNQGGLGIKVSVTSTSLTLVIPSAQGLAAMGLGKPPGAWYMRIVPTDANPSYCTFGTIVRFSYGIVGGLLKISGDDVFCKALAGPFFVSGARFDSNVELFLKGFTFNSPYVITAIQASFNGFGITGLNPGTYTVTAQETNSDCKGPMSDPFVFTVIDIPSTVITGPTPICAGDTFSYKVPFLAHTHYDWTINPLNSAEVDTGNNVIKINFHNAGTYSLTVNAFNMCGQKSGKKTVVVKPQPPVSAIGDTAICAKDSVLLVANVGTVTNYWWESGASTVAKLVKNIKVAPSQTTAYSINIKDATGCKNADTVLVTVMTPSINPAPDSYICIGNSTQLTASGADLYFWSPVEGLSSAIIPNPIANPVKTTTYILTEKSTFGCSIEDTIKVYVLGSDDYNDQIKLCEGEPVVLTTDVDGVLYLWNTSETTQSITVSAPGNYLLTLTSPFDNCQATQEFNVFLSSCDFQLFVPKAFTPNGDNKNDVFYAYPSGVDEFKMYIFDRWGNLLFTSNNPSVGWNGTYKGTVLENDIYVWKIEISGNVEGTKRSEIRTGSVALIR